MQRETTWSGISPVTLIQQVQNTIPFLFTSRHSNFSRTRYIDILISTQKNLSGLLLDHYQYFELCLAAHFATVGSFVPTDVDNQIRAKIWQTSPDTDTSLRMLPLLYEMYDWDILPVAARWVKSLDSNYYLSGIKGEWLGVMAAAYSAVKTSAPKIAQEIQERIIHDLKRQEKVFWEHHKARNGIQTLEASTLIAHNLGDLDRVIDIWKLRKDDSLRTAVYKIGHQANEYWGEKFVLPGQINKKFMAIENHRHFPLREPRGLRRERDFLLPLGPFLDRWGEIIATHSALEERDRSEVIEALIKGFMRLAGPIGYARALTGIAQAYPGGMKALGQLLPVKIYKQWQSGKLREVCSIARNRFEERWSQLPFK